MRDIIIVGMTDSRTVFARTIKQMEFMYGITSTIIEAVTPFLNDENRENISCEIAVPHRNMYTPSTPNDEKNGLDVGKIM